MSPSEVELQRPLADVRTAAGYTVAEWGRAIGVNSWFVPKHVRAAEGKIGPFPEKLAAVLAPFPDFGSVDPAQTAQLSGADIDLLRNHLQDLASGNAEFHAGLYRIFDLLSAVDTHRGTDYAFEQVPALMRRCGSGPEASRGDTPFGLSQALRLAVDSAQRSGRGENLQLLLALLPELEAGSSTTDLSYSQELLAQLLETVAGLPPDSRPTAGQMANLHTLYRNQLLGEVTADETLLKQGMGFHNAGKVNETVAKFMDWAVRLEIHDPHIPGLRDLIDLSADREFFNWLPIDNLGQRAGVRFVGALEAFTRR